MCGVRLACLDCPASGTFGMLPAHTFRPHHHIPSSTDVHSTHPHPADMPCSTCVHVHFHMPPPPSPMTSHTPYPQTNVSRPLCPDGSPWVAPRPHPSSLSPAPWPHVLPTTSTVVFMTTSRRCVVGNRCVVWFRRRGCRFSRCIGCGRRWCRHGQVMHLTRSDCPQPSPTRPNPR